MPRLTMLVAVLTAFAGCTALPAEEESARQAFTSDQATLLDFAFEGELLTRTLDAKPAIELQLLHSIGQLIGEDAGVGLDGLVIERADVSSEGAWQRVRYAARLPVAWPKRSPVPERYTLMLPLRADESAMRDFATRYGEESGCLTWADGHVHAGNHWYYYRPTFRGCVLAPEDVVRVEARVTKSEKNTTAKYPEYDRVWEDGQLDVVVIFGMFSYSSRAADDLLGKQFLTFVSTVESTLEYGPGLAHFPNAYPYETEWRGDREAIVSGTAGDDRQVRMTALLVDSVVRPDEAFTERLRALTASADLVLYGGHSEYGAAIRSMSELMGHIPGQYRILFLDGCNTFAYFDETLSTMVQTGDLDLLVNALASPADAALDNSLAFVDAFLGEPKTYEEILGASMDRRQMVLVLGEEDNTFTP